MKHKIADQAQETERNNSTATSRLAKLLSVLSALCRTRCRRARKIAGWTSERQGIEEEASALVVVGTVHNLAVLLQVLE